MIKFIYQKIFKPILFLFDPEFVHDRVLFVGKLFGKIAGFRKILAWLFSYQNELLVQELAGVRFANPVGLSAGFDKNAELINILPSVGFGSMEVGSVTWEAYQGNPKPRLFRLKKSKGLIVYYGLKNIGAFKIAKKVNARINNDFRIGISVAKTNCERTSSTSAGIDDYLECLKVLEQEKVGDFYTINISCPNTFGGEPFTTAETLNGLLNRIAQLQIQKPVFIKMPINLTWQEFDLLLKVIVKYKFAGVVIGNLTKVRDPKLIKDEIPEHIKGGISGKPTWELSNHLIAKTYEKYGDKLIIIGVGGIFSAEDTYHKIKLGASMGQLITGMIFEGPQLIGQINRELVDFLKKDGFSNISEAVGVLTKPKS